jgi:hypothetical protein
MLRKISVSFALVACLVYPAHALDVPLKQLPATSRWVLHLDTRGMLNTTTGTALKEAVRKSKAGRQLEAVRAITGIDLLNDISSLTLCGPDARKENAVLFARGRMEPERLIALLRLNESFAQESYNGRLLFRWRDEKKGGELHYGCFYSERLALVSPGKAALRRSIDVLDGKAENLSGSETFSNASKTADGFVFAGVVEGLDAMEGVRPKAAILKRIANARLLLGESGDEVVAEIHVDADTEDSAKKMEDVCRGLLAFATLSADEKPELVQLLKEAVAGSDGRRVNMVLRYPVRRAVERIRERIPPVQEKAKDGKAGENAEKF